MTEQEIEARERAYEQAAPADHAVVDAVAMHLHANERRGHGRNNGPCTDCWRRAGRAVGITMQHAEEKHVHDAERITSLGHSIVRLHNVIKAVMELADGWKKLAPSDDWGESMDDTLLSDAGRTILNTIRTSFKEASHEQRAVAGPSDAEGSSEEPSCQQHDDLSQPPQPQDRPHPHR